MPDLPDILNLANLPSPPDLPDLPNIPDACGARRDVDMREDLRGFPPGHVGQPKKAACTVHACPTVGDFVRILDEDVLDITGSVGMIGEIIRDDESARPYKVQFSSGKLCWYKQEWVEFAEAKIRRMYLPMEISGVDVVVEENKNNWRVTTEDVGLRSSSAGLGYRKSKHLEDKVGKTIAHWGELVYGFDEGDGWLRIR